MANVVESTSTTAETSTTSLVITKPTGLAVGDLLNATIFDSAGAPATPAGWTSILSTALSPRFVKILAKIADSSDVAASNFSFGSSGGTTTMSGALMRVSGVRTDTLGDDSENQSQTNTSAPASWTTSLSPTTIDSYLVLVFTCGTLNTSGAVNKDITLPIISGTNPTWTRRFIVGNGLSTSGLMYCVFTSVVSASSNITSLTATYEGFTASSDLTMSLVTFGALQNTTGTNTLLSVSPAFFAENGIAGTTGTNTLLSVSPTLFAQSGHSQNMPVWTNPDKETTTWTNPDK